MFRVKTVFDFTNFLYKLTSIIQAMKLILAENTFFCFLFVLAPSSIPLMVLRIEIISTVFCLLTLDRDVLILSKPKNLVITKGNNKNECITNNIHTKPKRVCGRQLDNVSTNTGKERIAYVKYKQFHSAHTG